ncbi:MAG: hypothetical protein AAF288_14495 [Planctomycetota bacterium]
MPAPRAALSLSLALGVACPAFAQDSPVSAQHDEAVANARPATQPGAQTTENVDPHVDLLAHQAAMDRAQTWVQDARAKRERTAGVLEVAGVNDPEELQHALRAVDREIELAEQAFAQYQQRYRQLVAAQDAGLDAPPAEDNTDAVAEAAVNAEADAKPQPDWLAQDPVFLQLQEQQRALDLADQNLAAQGYGEGHPARRQLAAQRSALERRIAEYRAQVEQAGPAATPLHHLEQARQALQQQLRNLEAQRESVVARYGPDHPAVRQIDQARLTLESELRRLNLEIQPPDPQ